MSFFSLGNAQTAASATTVRSYLLSTVNWLVGAIVCVCEIFFSAVFDFVICALDCWESRQVTQNTKIMKEKNERTDV